MLFWLSACLTYLNYVILQNNLKFYLEKKFNNINFRIRSKKWSLFFRWQERRSLQFVVDFQTAPYYISNQYLNLKSQNNDSFDRPIYFIKIYILLIVKKVEFHGRKFFAIESSVHGQVTLKVRLAEIDIILLYGLAGLSQKPQFSSISLIYFNGVIEIPALFRCFTTFFDFFWNSHNVEFFWHCLNINFIFSNSIFILCFPNFSIFLWSDMLKKLYIAMSAAKNFSKFLFWRSDKGSIA